MQAIETEWKGYRFRSRLEARWAVFFEELDLSWDYEVQGYEFKDGTKYLPDFWLPQVSMWAEVKGGGFTHEEMRKAILLAKKTEYPCLLLNSTPQNRAYKGVHPEMPSTPRSYILSYHPPKNYPSTEGRLFCCPGCTCHEYRERGCESCRRQDTERAVKAARSARFEHGESPSISNRAPAPF